MKFTCYFLLFKVRQLENFKVYIWLMFVPRIKALLDGTGLGSKQLEQG